MIAIYVSAAAAATATAVAEACNATDLAADKASFVTNGYSVLRGLLSADEVDEIERGFDALTHPGPVLAANMGRDYGDQSQGHGVDPSKFALINVNNPGRYLPAFSPNKFIERAALAAEQLLGDGVNLDYEQLLEKVPGHDAAVFPWHQDMQYWPKRFPDGVPTRTATFSLALSDADEGNGCLRVVPHESGAPRGLVSSRSREEDVAARDHGAANTATDSAGDERAIVLPLRAAELSRAVPLTVRRGDVTVHDEWIVHGSGGNPSERVRKTYVVAFRDMRMVAYERGIGFSHSYNDDPAVLHRIRAGEL